MGQPTIQAHTVSVAANGTESFGGPLDGPATLRVRVPVSGVFVGGTDLFNSPSAANGFELNANQEYVFELSPTARLNNSVTEYQVHVWNSTGSAVSVSYVQTAR